MKNLKDEFLFLCYGLSKIDNEWKFYWGLLDKKDKNYPILKNKFTNLLEKLNNDDSELINMELEDIYENV